MDTLSLDRPDSQTTAALQAQQRRELQAAGVALFGIPCDGHGRLEFGRRLAIEGWVEADPRMFGLAAGPINLRSLARRISTPQRSTLRHALRRLVAQGAGDEAFDFALNWRDDSFRWMRLGLHASRDAHGKAVRLEASIRDVHEQRWAQEELALVSDRLRMTLQAAGGGMFGDAAGVRHVPGMEGARPGWQINTAALFGLPVDAPSALHDMVERIHPEDREGVLTAHLHTLASIGEVTRHEFRTIWPDGNVHWLLVTGTSRLDPITGQPVSTGVVMDITTRKKAEQDVAHAATHDHLTGLLNRAAFKRHLDSALDALQRHGDRFALMFIDLDGFKAVNDQHGHAAGDALLVELTCRMRSTVRTEDVLARLGGDEFVVLTRKVDLNTVAIAIARKLIASAAEPVFWGSVQMSVTASIGICFSADGQTADELLLRADAAMYQAKQLGKNRFCFASDV